MLDLAYTVFVLLLAAAIGCAVYRLWKGPTVGDRLNAADVIALCFVGLAVGHGWHTQSSVWLDVAMVAGLVLFVGTSAVSIYLDPAHLARNEHE